MNHLKSLNFTTVAKGSSNPTLSRRAKLISKLEEQKALAQDPNYLPTTKRWVKGSDGTKQLVEFSASDPSVVAHRRDRRDGAHRALRVQAYRVREGQGRHHRAVEGEARRRH